jgi:hypothetical protein
LKEINKLESQKQESRRFQLYFPHKDKIAQVEWNNQVKLTMARVKQVLWERRIAWLQAQEILKQETKKEELLEQGVKEENLEEELSKLDLNTDFAQVGRKQKRKKILQRGNRKPKDSRATSWTVV